MRVVLLQESLLFYFTLFFTQSFLILITYYILLLLLLVREIDREIEREMGDPPRSLTMIINAFTKTTFLYHKLHSHPLTLSVLKLDGSSFDIEVAKTANVAELKDSVEAVFSHMPQKGPAKISWPHVWSQFCLCYDGHKLVTEEDYLRNYGIKDGDQLRFIRHVSNSYSVRRKRLKKRVVISKQHGRSSSQVNSSQSIEHSDNPDEVCSDDIATESGKIRCYNEDEHRVGKNKLTEFVGVLFSSTRLGVVRQTRIKSKIFRPSMIAKCLLGSFGKIRRIVCFGRRRHYFRKHLLRKY